MMPWKIMRWADTTLTNEEIAKKLSYRGVTGIDENGKKVILFETSWNFDNFKMIIKI